MDAGVEKGECKVLEGSSPAQHPPGGHGYVMMDIAVL